MYCVLCVVTGGPGDWWVRWNKGRRWWGWVTNRCLPSELQLNLCSQCFIWLSGDLIKFYTTCHMCYKSTWGSAPNLTSLRVTDMDARKYTCKLWEQINLALMCSVIKQQLKQVQFSTKVKLPIYNATNWHDTTLAYYGSFLTCSAM